MSGPLEARSVPRSKARIEIDDGDTGGGGVGREIGDERKSRELRRTGFRKLREKFHAVYIMQTCITAV